MYALMAALLQIQYCFWGVGVFLYGHGLFDMGNISLEQF